MFLLQTSIVNWVLKCIKSTNINFREIGFEEINCSLNVTQNKTRSEISHFKCMETVQHNMEKQESAIEHFNTQMTTC
jgi:hypothetical protein